ncbi:MAG: hypothetical protein MUO54_14380 [Anaerolineales bacterium]|nr:hypothetical protein [Anaerolineales bacterium]
MSFFQQLIIPGLLFLIVVGFGFWVSRMGRPYNQVLFNFHKLIALGGVVLLAMRIININPLESFSTLMNGLIAAAAACAIVLFTTGAIMSIRDGETRLVLGLHQIMPADNAILTGWALFLLK